MVPAVSAEPIPSGEVAMCYDVDVRVSAWQATEAGEGYHPMTGVANMNATDGQSGPKNAYYHWHNLTTGASGDAEGWGNGTAGASAMNVITGAGEIEITAEFVRKGLFFSVDNTGQCTGRVTIV